MAELKLPRLLAAAKEFNVGQDTIIDFLIGKGFPKDEAYVKTDGGHVPFIATGIFKRQGR